MTDSTTITSQKTARTDFDIHPFLADRWSPRMFSQEALRPSDLSTLFEAARWAASSNNEQPWRFLYAFRDGDGKAFEKIFNCLSPFNQKWVRNAPLLMLTAIKEKFDNGKDNFHALHDLGLAMGNLSMQAQSMNIAVHSMAGVDWRKAHEAFGVGEGYHVATAVAIGYYGGDADELPEDLLNMEKAARTRKPQSQFAFEGACSRHEG